MSAASSATHRRLAPSKVHVCPDLINKLLAASPGAQIGTGVLFGRVEQDMVNILAFQRFPDSAAAGTTVFALLAETKSGAGSSSLAPVGWFRIRPKSQDDLGPNDLAFHNRYFRRATDIILFVTRPEAGRGIGLDLFARTSSEALSAKNYASSSVSVPGDVSQLEPLELPLHAGADAEWRLGVYQALYKLDQNGKTRPKRFSLLNSRRAWSTLGFALAVGAAILGWMYRPQPATPARTATVSKPIEPPQEQVQEVPLTLSAPKVGSPFRLELPAAVSGKSFATPPHSKPSFVLPSSPIPQVMAHATPHSFQPANPPAIAGKRRESDKQGASSARKRGSASASSTDSETAKRRAVDAAARDLYSATSAETGDAEYPCIRLSYGAGAHRFAGCPKD